MSEALDESALRPGERFARVVTFDADSIRTFARLSGDHNPLHHDVVAASAGPFGRLIACGPHVTSLMMGLDASYFARAGEALGLGFEFRFVKAVTEGTTLTLEWTILQRTPKASLRGDIVAVRGRAYDAAGAVYVEATGRNLVRARKEQA